MPHPVVTRALRNVWLAALGRAGMVRDDYPVTEAQFAVLDVPRDHLPTDADGYLRAAIAWHFGEHTGSPFWLRAAKALDFDPIAAVATFVDLRRFPNVVDQLRDLPVEDLIPRGYGSPPPVPRVFESGGTTGAAKRTAQLADWIEQVTRWQIDDFVAGGYLAGQGLLFVMPSGPHGVGYFDQAVAERLGSVFYPVDLDPRWVKKLTARRATAEVSAYLDHVVDQARTILESQRVANLHTTPPLLEAIARADDLVKLVNAKIRYILLSGAHIDIDTLELLREIFDATIATVFGSTMILSQAATRIAEDGSFIFDPRSPYVVFWVIDPHTGVQVPYGQRGQVVMNHISKGMFIPNNLERDTAIRVPGPDGQVGDSLTEVAPVAGLDGDAVIEGVY